ncbi:MAG: ribosome recycling factor [Acholeplasmataceae bacterium]|nr:ribosome recycling factor [Acholeplasmataceae bacterium]
MSEQADLILMDTEERMEKAIEALKRDFAGIRTGRANPALLDRIVLDYYGVETPLKQISSISVVEGNQLFIKPYDKSLLKQIEQAIYASNLGLNPLNDGIGIRLILPQPTEERRRELIKEVEKHGEGAKVAVRNIRRDSNDHMKKLGLSEDDEKGYLEDIQDLTDQFVKKVDQTITDKSEELLKI